MFFVLRSILPLDVEVGILAGLAVGLAGYFQAYFKEPNSEKREKFNWDKFLATVFLGAIAGGFLSYSSLLDDGVALFLSSAGIIAITESFIKILMRLK